MTKKIISTLLMFIFFSTGAQAHGQDGPKVAFDELNYSLSVEWDQNEPEFYESKVAEFEAIAKTYSDEEMLALIKSEIKNEKLVNDLLASKGPVELAKLFKDAGSKGASWSNNPLEHPWGQFAIGCMVLIGIFLGVGIIAGSVDN